MYPPFLHRGTSVLFKDCTACYALPKKRKTSCPCTIKIDEINLYDLLNHPKKIALIRLYTILPKIHKFSYTLTYFPSFLLTSETFNHFPTRLR